MKKKFNNKNFTISIIGAGYVGLSHALFLSTKYKVKLYDIDEVKINMLSRNESTLKDKNITQAINQNKNMLELLNDEIQAYENSDIVIICAPTNYDIRKNFFDTSAVEEIIQTSLRYNSSALLIIKSTIPVGFTKSQRKKFKTDNIVFSPEFLREDKALYDNFNPSRIILGGSSSKLNDYIFVLKSLINNVDTSIMKVGSDEAEAIKLFSNAYLAMRVSFFNELDSFSMMHKINSKNIIDGVSKDPRIGEGYNNPSFGFGGYCLPKDTAQLSSEFKDIEHPLIESILKSNASRKSIISREIIQKDAKSIGIYRIVMKKNSDNFRESSTLEVLKGIKKHNQKITIYEPNIKTDTFMGFKINNDIKKFKHSSDIIVANRLTNDLDDVKHKIFSRDIFNEN